ncbi:MAG TPA: UDP-3-O-acyl-N-acetylglucosamine deacetylase [Armatimonadota bacterium]|nr:UDP-3-O-acyl-N-acetylglucosamine deacetylase [Armatimonadota bacterium]
MTPTYQRTLKTSATVKGRGLHTGEECGINLIPAAPDTGVVFVTPRGEIRALVQNVLDTERATSLRTGDAEVHTVEHLLAALAGLGIDNVRVEVSGPEIPAGDGSALPFVELMESAGIEEQMAEARIVRPEGPVWTAEDGKYLLAVPASLFRVTALIAFQHPMIGEQAISVAIDPTVFKREIAPARTFCTADEIESIASQGLGKGGTEDNVVVVHDDRYSVALRFRDEFVRHKVLDLIGDISLVGGRLHADVVAVRTSHALNVALAGKIVREGWQGG